MSAMKKKDVTNRAQLNFCGAQTINKQLDMQARDLILISGT